MKANPGGQISINEIQGRDLIISSIWETLESQSVIMTAERRIGKTSIIKKMQAQPPKGWVPVFQDLEQHHSANEFAVDVYNAVQNFLGAGHKATKTLKDIWGSLGGTEIGGILTLPKGEGQPWKKLLTGTIENLAKNQKGKRLVFFWDEMPYMLDSIRKEDGENEAIAVLDVLRSLRQTHNDFRMVITGSVGLHHVLTSLKDCDYRNEPFNDLYSEEVPPLDQNDAKELAEKLITGEKLNVTDKGEIAREVAEQGDCFPFYIHHIIKNLKRTGIQVDLEAVQQSVQKQLVDPNDPWELAHYRERISQYYPQDSQLVLVVLDSLAGQNVSANVNDILSAVKSQLKFDDRDHLLRTLRLLERDHYLKRDMEGRYLFRFPLVKRWWLLDRGL